MGPTTAVVVAGDEEIRVLLRGLLRLHHFRVLGEAGGVGEGLELIRTHRPSLVVLDADLAEGTAEALLSELHRLAPNPRTVLVAPHRSGSHPALPEGGKPDALLTRPFRVREFAQAVGVETAAGSGA